MSSLSLTPLTVSFKIKWALLERFFRFKAPHGFNLDLDKVASSFKVRDGT